MPKRKAIFDEKKSHELAKRQRANYWSQLEKNIADVQLLLDLAKRKLYFHIFDGTFRIQSLVDLENLKLISRDELSWLKVQWITLGDDFVFSGGHQSFTFPSGLYFGLQDFETRVNRSKRVIGMLVPFVSNHTAIVRKWPVKDSLVDLGETLKRAIALEFYYRGVPPWIKYAKPDLVKAFDLCIYRYLHAKLWISNEQLLHADRLVLNQVFVALILRLLQEHWLLDRSCGTMQWRALPDNVSLQDYNSNNLHHNDPYQIVNGELLIDRDWWTNDVPQAAKQLIGQLTKFILGEVATPHAISRDPRLTIVYQSFQQAFEFQHWRHLKPESVVILLPAAIKQKLSAESMAEELASLAKPFLDGIHPWFVKTGSTSGKNEKPVEPCLTAADVLSRLQSVKEFQDREFSRLDKETTLVLSPWVKDLTSRSEFRVFVFRSKITAVCPQVWFQVHNYTPEELQTAEDAITTAAFLQEAPFRMYIADVYVDFATRTCHLIELNAFGDHSGAGSNLFDWERDQKLLYGHQEVPEFRFLSVINLSKEKDV